MVPGNTLKTIASDENVDPIVPSLTFQCLVQLLKHVPKTSFHGSESPRINVVTPLLAKNVNAAMSKNSSVQKSLRMLFATSARQKFQPKSFLLEANETAAVRRNTLVSS